MRHRGASRAGIPTIESIVRLRPRSRTGSSRSVARPFSGILALAALAALAPGPAAAADRRAPARGEQELAVFVAPHTAYAHPSPKARPVGYITQTRPITGRQTVFPVTGTAAQSGRTWLRVRLPGRPNGRTGWVDARNTAQRFTSFRIVVEISRRRVLVYWRDHRVRTFRAIVGKSATPTPQGRFFVEEMVPLPSSAAGAPFALATSARSNALKRFEGGVGQIALHGIGNLTGRMGSAASHGCVRLGPTAIRWLAKTMSAGVPILLRER